MYIFNYWVILIDKQHWVSITIVYWLIVHSWVHTFISHKFSRRRITVILFFKMNTSDLFTHTFITPKCISTNITFIFKINSSNMPTHDISPFLSNALAHKEHFWSKENLQTSSHTSFFHQNVLRNVSQFLQKIFFKYKHFFIFSNENL